MALMTDIRNNLSKLFAVLAFFFIIMIVFDWGLDLSGRRGRGRGNVEILGSVNGKEVDYKQYSDLVRRALDEQKKRTGVDPDDEADRQVRAQVWNQMVDDILIDQEIKRLGITVTDQEVVDIVRGPNPPEFLINQFKDSTGTFRRDAYERAMLDPQNKTAWVQVEDVLRADQKRRKLQSLLLSTVQVTEGETRQRFLDKSVSMDAEYLLFDANRIVPDSAVQVSDDDLRKQYESHAEEFKAKAGRRMKYVLFSTAASGEDSATVEQEVRKLLDDAKSGAMDFAEIAKTYSEVPQSDAYFSHGELSRTKEDAAFAAKKGEIVGPIRDADGIHLLKVLDERQGTKEFIHASHILINVIAPDTMAALQKARDLAKELRAGANFAALAHANSQDFASAQQGGDLGWTGKGRWVKPFEEAAFKARIGEIVGPVRTQFGWHIIRVTARDRREVKLATLTMRVKASSQTNDLAFKQAEDFAYLAKEEGFDKAAEFSKFQVRETPEFTKGGMVPGVGFNETANAFAFGGKVGAISTPINISGGAAVFLISNVREEGMRALDEVKPYLHTFAVRDKKMAIVRAQAEALAKTLTPATDLLAIASQVPQAISQRTGPFKATDVPAGVGRDLKFIGVACAMKEGEISRPFEGSRGYFIIRLMAKSVADTTRYAIERVSLRDQILQERRNRVLQEWQTSLRERAEIEDHRDKFFR